MAPTGTVKLVPARPSPRDHPYFDAPAPLPIAHRGFSRTGAENSMTAFAAAIDLGYRYLETDARATRDGVVLAFHDGTLDRVTDRRGRISELTWDEVRRARIRGSEPIPLLEEVLDAWPQARFNIDVKDAATIGPLARVIDRTKAHDRICLGSFSDRRRRAVVRRLSAPVATSAGRMIVARFRTVTSVRLLARYLQAVLHDVDCIQVPERIGRISLVSPAAVDAVHRAGKQVHVWTVNDEAAMHRLLDLGVDGIMTDRADLLRDVMQTRGDWPGS
jgi:glycerophosphoryl diester phosphodiesterase